MTSLSVLDASPTGGAKIIEIAAPCLMALTLPLAFAGLGFLDSVSVGLFPLAFYLGLVALIYAPALARTCVLAYRAYQGAAHGDLAWYTVLPSTVLLSLVSPGPCVTAPYEIGVRTGLTLFAAGF